RDLGGPVLSGTQSGGLEVQNGDFFHEHSWSRQPAAPRLATISVTVSHVDFPAQAIHRWSPEGARCA
ncbi:MAG: hypothetical protein NTV19_19720, partial [Burkholderiales bacterium]|nr:hypothetical protein [Burkholderiales bacterium]